MNVPFAPYVLWPIPLFLFATALLLRRGGEVSRRFLRPGPRGRDATGDTPAEENADRRERASENSRLPKTDWPLGRTLSATGIVIVAAVLLLSVIAVLVGALAGAGLGVVYLLYGLYLIGTLGVVFALVGWATSGVAAAPRGSRVRRASVWGLSFVGVVWSLCILFFSVPPLEGRLVDLETGKPLSGARVGRTVFRQQLFSTLLGTSRGEALAEGSAVTTTDTSGAFRLSGWVEPWPTGLLGIPGVAVIAQAEDHVLASLCASRDPKSEPTPSDDSCLNLPRTPFSELRKNVEWSLRRVTVNLRVGKLDSPEAAEVHFNVLSGLIIPHLLTPTDFARELEGYDSRFQLTESVATYATDVAGQWDSPSHPWRYATEAARILNVVTRYRDSTLDADELTRLSQGDAFFAERIFVEAKDAARPGGPCIFGGTPVPQPPKELEGLLASLGRPPYLQQWRSLVALRPSGEELRLQALAHATWMWELLACEACPQETRESLKVAASELARSLPLRSRTDTSWLYAVPRVTLLTVGHEWPGTAALLSRLWVPFRAMSDSLLPAFEVRERPVMVVPTGGFAAREKGDPAYWRHYAGRLRRFVETGGTLVVLAQGLGADLSLLPVPDSEALVGKGYREANAPRPSTARCRASHPVCSWFKPDQVFSIQVAGGFERWPRQAEVLIADAATNSPLALLYPVGRGFVVATSLNEDVAFFAKRGTETGRVFLAGVLRWALHEPSAMVALHSGKASTLTFSATVRNSSQRQTTSVEWVMAGPPPSQGIVGAVQQVELGPGASAQTTVNLSVPREWLSKGGLYQIAYRLLDGKRTPSPERDRYLVFQVQPPREAALLGILPD